MAILEKPTQGVLDIRGIQGNYRKIDLVFDFTEWDDVTDLTDFDAIKMEIKETRNAGSTAFISFDLVEGLVISGEDNLTLSFELDETFWDRQVVRWLYDITFLFGEKRYTLIKGTITNDLTVSKI